MFDSHLSFAQANGYSRPHLTRSRSHTNPSSSLRVQAESQDGGTTNEQIASLRPTHSRTRSYLPPSSHEHSKTRAILTAPVTSAASAFEKSAEKLPRLHLPGSSHRHHHHSLSNSHSYVNAKGQASERSSKHDGHRRGHRSTQSEAHAHKSGPRSREGLPNLVAGLNAERVQHSQHQGRDAFGPGNASMADYASGGRFDPLSRSNAQTQYRAAPGDSQQPEAALTRRPSTVSELMARGDAARFAKRLHVKKHEIEQRDAEIATAEEELRSRIGEITSAGVEITRRLDYGYYNLLEKVNSLVGTIRSFQSLSRQTAVMIHNFEKETHRIDGDARRRIDAFHEGMEKRAEKGQALKARGEQVGAKAEQLEARLENARIILQNWEAREERGRERWRNAGGIMGWSLALLVGLVLVLALSKPYWSDAGDVLAAMTHASPHAAVMDNHNQNHHVSDLLDRGANLPDDVKKIMHDIAARSNLANRSVALPGSLAAPSLKGVSVGLGGGGADDPRLRRLDEL